MNKVKVRCSVCGKSFKTPSLKKTVCPDCDAAAKRARHQATPGINSAPVVASAATVDVRAALRAAQENQGQFGAYRPPAAPQMPAPAATHPVQAATHAPAMGATAHARPAPKGRSHRAEKSKAARPTRARKPRMQMKPFEPSEEQRTAIRERYLQLADPEYDGIRHQIATEMGIPLRAVKDVVKQVRTETATPSWWERTGNLPPEEIIEQIRALYLPQLPTPEVGVHKHIAAQLKLTHTSVYQAIGRIRDQLELPRYSARPEGQPGLAGLTGYPASSGSMELQTATGE